MSENRLVRYFAGYLVGTGIFVIIIPSFILASIHFVPWGMFSNHSMGKAFLVGFGLFFIIPGVVFVLWSNVYLAARGKGGPTAGLGLAISPETTYLVTEGPYRYTRNPMAFGMLSIYLSIVLFCNSLFGLIIVSALSVGAVFYLKSSEEKRLRRDFGDEFTDYKNRTPMLFPIPIRKNKKV